VRGRGLLIWAGPRRRRRGRGGHPVAGRDLRPVLGRRYRDHFLAGDFEPDLDRGAEIAEEGHRAGQGVQPFGAGGTDRDIFRPDGDHHRGAGGGRLLDGERAARDLDPPRAGGGAGQEIGHADEIGDEGIGRPAVDLDRRGGLENAPFRHDHDQIGHGHGFALVVGDHDGGDAELLLELFQLDLHRLAELGVERGERLVEQEQPGREGERAGDGDPLALPAREFGDRPVGRAGQAHEAEQALDRVPLFRLGLAPDAQRIGDVLAHGQMGKQGERLEHHAEVALMRRLVGEIRAVDQQAALARRVQSGDHAEQRGLAAARRAEQADEFPMRDGQCGVMHGGEAAITLDQMIENQTRHGAPLGMKVFITVSWPGAVPAIHAWMPGTRPGMTASTTERQPAISSVHFWLSQSALV